MDSQAGVKLQKSVVFPGGQAGSLVYCLTLGRQNPYAPASWIIPEVLPGNRLPGPLILL
jgi:hypothetical protein